MRIRQSLLVVTTTIAVMVPGVAGAQVPVPNVQLPVPVPLPLPVPVPVPVPVPKPQPKPADPSGCEHGSTVPTAGTAAETREATLCLLNRERTSRGLGRLSQNESLANAATNFSREMVQRNFFDHVSPGGSTLVQRIKRTSYLRSARSWALGENIAWGSGSLATPASTVRAWMRSTSHRRNILTGRYRHIGIGIVAGAPVRLPTDQDAATYTTDFGAR